LASTSDVKALLLLSVCSVLFPVLLFGNEGGNAPPEFKALPADLRQQATAVFTARFVANRGSMNRNGKILHYQERAGSLQVTATHFGLAPENMAIDPESLPSSKYVDPEPESGRSYLVVLGQDQGHGQTILAFVYLAPKADRVDIVDFGAFRREAREPRKDAPDTSSRYVNVVAAETTPTLLHRTDRIDGAVGTTFGLLFRAAGITDEFGGLAPIRIRVLHPPTTNPQTGNVTRTEEWDAPANLGIIRFTGWTFDAPWELVPGTWTIEILQDGEVMARKEFTVTAPPPSK
jgi:hypothetical protein